MGISSKLTNMLSASPLALLVVAVASLTLSATGKYTYLLKTGPTVGTFPALLLSVLSAALHQCSPKIPGIRLPGECMPLRQCAYFMRILAASTVSQEDRQLLRESQCNDDKNIHVGIYLQLSAIRL